MPRILVVEDQKTLLQNLVRGLEGAGYEVYAAATGEDAATIALAEQVDAVILDLMLPGKGGLEVLGDLRAEGFASPVLILTARDSVDDRVSGLDSGADDYLIKPFAFAELLARIRVLLRRGPIGRGSVLLAADLELDLIARRVTRAGKAVELTAREFELLEYLIRHKDEPITRDMLSADVWKEPMGAITNIIDVYINAVRKKLERPGAPAVSVHGSERHCVHHKVASGLQARACDASVGLDASAAALNQLMNAYLKSSCRMALR